MNETISTSISYCDMNVNIFSKYIIILDDAGESSVITAITNTDISEQNVPETGEKFECTDIVESGTEETKDEQIASSIPEQKTYNIIMLSFCFFHFVQNDNCNIIA